VATPAATATASVTVSASAVGGAVFVVDSTGYLYSFDASGNVLTKVHLPGIVSDINGGEIALANGNVYVTIGGSTSIPSNAVVAYTQASLAPVALGSGAFAGLSVPRGIAYDSHNNQFYIGNGGASVTVYDVNGNTVAVTGGWPLHYGPSGMAFDPDNDTLWVANYAGYVGATYGVQEYTEQGGVYTTINPSTQFVSPNAHTEPYSIAYCPGNCAANVVVGFIDDGSGTGVPTVAGYATSGSSADLTFSVVKPYQLTFDAQTDLWIADKGGLLECGLVVGCTLAPAGFASALTPPVYGVAAH